MSAVFSIPLTVGVVTALICGVAELRHRYSLPAEFSRKIVHVGSGLLALGVPWMFDSPYPVAAACAINVVFLALARHTTVFPARLNEGECLQVGKSGL